MNDDALYDEVARELQAKTMVPGVWTRAFAEAGGDLNQARALYIKYRVIHLAEIRSSRLKEDRQVQLLAQKKRALSGFKRLALVFLALFCGLLTFFFTTGVAMLFMGFSVTSVVRTVVMGCFAIVFGVLTLKSLKAALK